MTNRGRRFFSGSTLEQAVMQAASHYQIDPDEVVYRKIEKRHGFLKTSRGVVIDVDPDNPRRALSSEAIAPDADTVADAVERGSEPESETQGDEPVQVSDLETVAEWAQDSEEDVSDPSEPLPVATGEMAEAAHEAVEALLEVAGLELDAEIFQGDGQLEIELSGAGQQELVADRGNLLLAIQHLLPRTIRGLTGRSVPCRVDSGNFHRMQEQSLERLANKVADEVKREQTARSLDPMNPAERRIIHLTLADDDGVVTESQGRGFFKRVSVRPARANPRGFDPYNR